MLIFRTKDYCTFWAENSENEVVWTGQEGYRLFNGDSVRLEGDKPVLVERSSNLQRIVGILQTSSKVRHGIDKRGHLIYIFRPIDNALPEFLVGSHLNNQLQNQWCIVDFLDWENTQKRPRAAIVSYLGLVGDYNIEKTALYKHYRGVPVEHKSLKCLYEKQLLEIGDYYRSGEWKTGRVDLTTLDTYSIDPEGCKDIDDAFSLTNDTLYIHIADLTTWIKEGTPLDTIAQRYYSTLYGDGVNFPMLPRELSENICSLIHGAERAALTLEIKFMENKIIGQTLYQSVIRNNNPLTYDKSDTIVNRAIPFSKVLAEKLALKETDNIDSHKLVEIFMVYYNMYVAGLDKCGLFRIQKEAILGNYPAELAFMNLESANYSLENKGHYCLGINHYTHASSPIRRYADIIVQRMIVYSIKTTDKLVRDMNLAQKLDKKFYRDLTFLTAIYKGDRRVQAIVLDSRYIYISSWKQKVRYDNSLEVYSRIDLDFYVDPNPIQWKKKIVFSK